MIVYNRVLRGGLWLSRRKKWLPLAFIISACLALFLATPYAIIHGGFILPALCVLIALAGLGVRCAAGRRSCGSLEQTIASGGIYSVIRFPYYLADMLLILALTLYTGVVWFVLLMIPVGYFIVERIILSEENSLINKHGDTYLHWCKETNAFIPAILNWNSSSCKMPFFALLAKESRVVLMTVGGFCLINLLKHIVVEFSFTLGFGWLAALLGAVAIFILGRISLRR